MVETELIKTPTTDFHLKAPVAGQLPEIERNDTADHISVNYVNRFTIYDESETQTKAVQQ